MEDVLVKLVNRIAMERVVFNKKMALLLAKWT
jgi:hypothetical protein